VLHHLNVFRWVRAPHHDLCALLSNAGNHLALPTECWRNVDAHVRAYAHATTADIERDLAHRTVTLEHAAVALHHHALQLLPWAPDTALQELDVAAYEYGHPVSFLVLAQHRLANETHGTRAWCDAALEVLQGLMLARVLEEQHPGNALSREATERGERLLGTLRAHAVRLHIDADAEAEKLTPLALARAAWFRRLYRFPARALVA